MKRVVRWLLGLFGMEIVRVNKHPTENAASAAPIARTTLADALEHIAGLSKIIGFQPMTVIDVGVADGTYELYNNFPNSRLLLVEPLQEFTDVLKTICTQYDATYTLAAASSRTGKTTINISPDLSGSSILKPRESYLNCKTREIPTVTIDNLVDEYGLKGPFIIKIDAQSSELLVLEGAVKTLPTTEVAILEIPLFQFVENGPQFYDIIDLLKREGFAVYDIVGHNYRPLDRALAEVDIIFVKENGVFRASHLFASPEQRREQFAKPDKRF